MTNNIDKASNQDIQKLKKALVKHQNEGFLHWDTTTHKEFMKKQTMEFRLGIEILKWTYWLAEYLAAPLQVFGWWSCQGWTAAAVSGSPSSRGAVGSPAPPVHNKEDTNCKLEEKAPGMCPECFSTCVLILPTEGNCCTSLE